MNVVVIGFKSAGKSTVGPLLAKRLGLAFDDLDRRLSEAASQMLGEKIDFREAFRRLGEEGFRKLERRLLREAMEEDGLVLSLGGGTPMDPEAPETLEGHCVVYVQAPEADLVRRIRAAGWPAYLEREPDPESALRRLLGERLPHYEKMANVLVENPDGGQETQTVEKAVRLVKQWMEKHG